MSAATPNPLVDQYQSHLKFNGRTPRTLQELLIAKASDEHARRLAEIKAMAPKLAQLDTFLPPLAERNLSFSRRQITTHDHGKTLRIERSFFSYDEKLYAALIELGFKEVDRKAFIDTEEQVTMKHGRSLQLTIYLRKVAAVVEPVGSES